MKSIRDMLIDAGVFCPIHGVDYDMECEKCDEITRDYVVRNRLYIVFMKIMQIPPIQSMSLGARMASCST